MSSAFGYRPTTELGEKLDVSNPGTSTRVRGTAIASKGLGAVWTLVPGFGSATALRVRAVVRDGSGAWAPVPSVRGDTALTDTEHSIAPASEGVSIILTVTDCERFDETALEVIADGASDADDTLTGTVKVF